MDEKRRGIIEEIPHRCERGCSPKRKLTKEWDLTPLSKRTLSSEKRSEESSGRHGFTTASPRTVLLRRYCGSCEEGEGRDDEELRSGSLNVSVASQPARLIPSEDSGSRTPLSRQGIAFESFPNSLPEIRAFTSQDEHSPISSISPNSSRQSIDSTTSPIAFHKLNEGNPTVVCRERGAKALNEDDCCVRLEFNSPEREEDMNASDYYLRDVFLVDTSDGDIHRSSSMNTTSEHDSRESISISRPMPDQSAFESSGRSTRASCSSTSTVCPPTPIRTPKWAQPIATPFLGKQEWLNNNRAFVVDGQEVSGAEQIDFQQDFDILDYLGSGFFSEVYKVRLRWNGKMYAVKKSKRRFRGAKERDRYLREVDIYLRLGSSSEYTIKTYGAWQEQGYFYTQIELCSRFTLRHVFQASKCADTPVDVMWKILHDVSHGLAHIHEMNVVHLDIKPSNIFISGDYKLKIGDFGLATNAGESEDGLEGDVLYMAKELLNSTKKYPSADIFSLGIMLYEMGKKIELPSDGEEWHRLREGRIERFTDHRYRDIEGLIQWMMRPNPVDRLEAKELVAQVLRFYNCLGNWNEEFRNILCKVEESEPTDRPLQRSASALYNLQGVVEGEAANTSSFPR